MNLWRTYYDDATMGRLDVDEGKSLYTIEKPWANNTPDISCVPEADYQLKPYFSPRHQWWTFCLVNPSVGIYMLPSDIPPGIIGRSTCEIDIANWAFQLNGCFACGLDNKSLPEYPNLHAVSNSKDARDRLFEWMTVNGDIQHAPAWTLHIQKMGP
jgi:hypothetical protein